MNYNLVGGGPFCMLPPFFLSVPLYGSLGALEVTASYFLLVLLLLLHERWR